MREEERGREDSVEQNRRGGEEGRGGEGEERTRGEESDKLGLRPIGVILRSNQAVKDMGEIHETRI